MPNYRHVVRLPYLTGLPEDIAVNVWHSISDDDTEAAGFATALITFYQAIDAYLGTILNSVANSCSVTTYDLSDPEPRAPTNTQTFTIAISGTALPAEVAMCLSFQGIRISGQPQARRRGRVYLGPLGSNALDGASGRPASAFLTAIDGAATALLAAPAPGTVGVWAVYSPTDNQTVPVAGGWIDNEWDTIRERGRGATTRTLF